MKLIPAKFFSKVQTNIRYYSEKTCTKEKVRPKKITASFDKIEKSRQKDVYFTNHAKKYQGFIRLKDIYYLPHDFRFSRLRGLSCKVQKYRLISDISILFFIARSFYEGDL